MRLVYTGRHPDGTSAIALPEGWPARDHDERDAAKAKQKVASGHYQPASTRKRSAPATAAKGTRKAPAKGGRKTSPAADPPAGPAAPAEGATDGEVTTDAPSD